MGTDTVYNQLGTTIQTAEVDDDAITLAKMAAGTAGNLISYSAAGDPAAVVTGTAAQVLTSNGAGAAPTFQAASSGLTFLGKTTLGAAATSISVSAFTTTAYDSFLITFNIDPDTNAANTLGTSSE